MNSILPELAVAETETATVIEETESTLVKKTFVFNFEAGDFTTDTMGRAVTTSDPEKVLQGVVDKVLHDDRYKHLAHDDSWGNEVSAVLAQDYPFDILASELRRVYREALIYNPLVSDIEDFSAEQVGDTVYCTFTVVGVSGIRLQRKEVLK